MNPMSFHVFKDGYWLADDEKSWTSDFLEAAGFTDAKLATDIGEREAGGAPYYVFACMSLCGV